MVAQCREGQLAAKYQFTLPCHYSTCCSEKICQRTALITAWWQCMLWIKHIQQCPGANTSECSFAIAFRFARRSSFVTCIEVVNSSRVDNYGVSCLQRRRQASFLDSVVVSHSSWMFLVSGRSSSLCVFCASCSAYKVP